LGAAAVAAWISTRNRVAEEVRNDADVRVAGGENVGEG
jgi:hypothetical protein